MYEQITNQIIEKLNAGVRPWTKPYEGGGFSMPKRVTGEYYKGINVVVLWLTAEQHGFTSPYWMTAPQAYKLGGSNKGQKSAARVMVSKPQTKEDADGNEYTYRMTKFMPVFNVDQITGLPDNFYSKPSIPANPDGRIDDVDRFISSIDANIQTSNGTPCYIPHLDRICMPDFAAFRSALDYYSTLTHEVVHWSGHESRLDRLNLKNKKGYAFEELVAELGASFLMAHLGLEPTVRDDHAEYIGSWIKALSDDHKYIFQAAAAAQKAVDFINNEAATTINVNAA